MAMDMSFRVESSFAKSIWKVPKIVIAGIWKRLKSDHHKLIGGLIEPFKQGKLERDSRKVFHANFSQHDFEFSCEDSPNPIRMFELAKNRRRYFPCMSLPTVIEDYLDKECSTGNFNTLSPPLSPYPMSFSNCSPDNEVDLKADKFISKFKKQISKSQ